MTNALLLTMMSAAPGGDAELNDWARTEHVPERMRIAGFRTAVRFASPNLMAAPRYLALYDIDDLNVLETSDYLAVSGVNLSPWSKRILAGVSAHWRFVGAQVGPEATRRATCAAGLATEILVAAWRGVVPSSVEAFAAIVSDWPKDPNVLQARGFTGPAAEGNDHVLIVESSEPFMHGMPKEVAEMTLESLPCEFVRVFRPLL